MAVKASSDFTLSTWARVERRIFYSRVEVGGISGDVTAGLDQEVWNSLAIVIVRGCPGRALSRNAVQVRGDA